MKCQTFDGLSWHSRRVPQAERKTAESEEEHIFGTITLMRLHCLGGAVSLNTHTHAHLLAQMPSQQHLPLIRMLPDDVCRGVRFIHTVVIRGDDEKCPHVHTYNISGLGLTGCSIKWNATNLPKKTKFDMKLGLMFIVKIVSLFFFSECRMTVNSNEKAFYVY